ncbi:hypothetical protein K4039_12325 [Lyngbya sp. CCAP 1446/10]|uniref:hypothetical protein n=1 Tax=Microcoleaceae TaxID=1892252 RepID=UPI002236F56A|nr:hypothetical protein [Lyngbya sp. CCAP 1446/10]MCW6050853.1 hypothetical protein [Lyngbya sp. CCAP 1446/10]
MLLVFGPAAAARGRGDTGRKADRTYRLFGGPGDFRPTRGYLWGVWGAKTEGSGFAVTVVCCVTAVVLRSRQIFELAIG